MGLREDKLLKEGKELYQRGQLNLAEKLLTEIVEVDDRHVEALFTLANIFHARGEIGKAIKAFNKVLFVDPNHTDAAISLSVLYNDIGQYDEARKIFEQTNERVKKNASENEGVQDAHINKKFSLKHYELAELYLTYSRFDEALFEYNKSIKLDPENLDARIKVAKVYAKKGFVAKAMDELRKLKTENPSFLPARLALGILYYGNGKVIEAQNEWENILSKDPAHSEAKMYINLSKTATETSLQV